MSENSEHNRSYNFGGGILASIFFRTRITMSSASIPQSKQLMRQRMSGSSSAISI